MKSDLGPSPMQQVVDHVLKNEDKYRKENKVENLPELRAR